jgi:hypothetical protein
MAGRFTAARHSFLFFFLPGIAATLLRAIREESGGSVAVEEAFFVHHHHVHNNNQEEHAKKQVRVYIESGCPDSREFCLYSIKHALKPEQGLAPLIDVSLIAWGNAYHNGVTECEHVNSQSSSDEYNRDDSHCWQKHCKNGTTSADCFDDSKGPVHQHGPKEGEVDRLINCAMKHMAPSPWPYVQCLLTHYEKVDTSAALAATCKEETADSVEPNTIDTSVQCAGSDEGKTLLMQAAKYTPKHPGVPWVTIDGDPVDSEKFFEELCKRVTPAVPPACVAKSSKSSASAADATSAKVMRRLRRSRRLVGRERKEIAKRTRRLQRLNHSRNDDDDDDDEPPKKEATATDEEAVAKPTWTHGHHGRHSRHPHEWKGTTL